MVHHSESSFVKICIKNTDILRAFVSNLNYWYVQSSLPMWPPQLIDHPLVLFMNYI